MLSHSPHHNIDELIYYFCADSDGSRSNGSRWRCDGSEFVRIATATIGTELTKDYISATGNVCDLTNGVERHYVVYLVATREVIPWQSRYNNNNDAIDEPATKRQRIRDTLNPSSSSSSFVNTYELAYLDFDNSEYTPVAKFDIKVESQVDRPSIVISHGPVVAFGANRRLYVCSSISTIEDLGQEDDHNLSHPRNVESVQCIDVPHDILEISTGCSGQFLDSFEEVGVVVRLMIKSETGISSRQFEWKFIDIHVFPFSQHVLIITKLSEFNFGSSLHHNYTSIYSLPPTHLDTRDNTTNHILIGCTDKNVLQFEDGEEISVPYPVKKIQVFPSSENSLQSGILALFYDNKKNSVAFYSLSNRQHCLYQCQNVSDILPGRFVHIPETVVDAPANKFQFVCVLDSFGDCQNNNWDGKSGIVLTDLICEFITSQDATSSRANREMGASQLKAIKTVNDALHLRHAEALKELDALRIIKDDKDHIAQQAVRLVSSICSSLETSSANLHLQQRSSSQISTNIDLESYYVISQVQCFYENASSISEGFDRIGEWTLSVTLQNSSHSSLFNLTLLATSSHSRNSLRSRSTTRSALLPRQVVTLTCHIPITRDILPSSYIPILLFLQFSQRQSVSEVLHSPTSTVMLFVFHLFAFPTSGEHFYYCFSSKDITATEDEDEDNMNKQDFVVAGTRNRILSIDDERYTLDLLLSASKDLQEKLSLNLPNVTLQHQPISSHTSHIHLKAISPHAILPALQLLTSLSSTSTTPLQIYHTPRLLPKILKLLDLLKLETRTTADWLMQWLDSAAEVYKTTQSQSQSQSSSQPTTSKPETQPLPRHILLSTTSLLTEYFERLPSWLRLQRQSDEAAIALFAEAEFLTFPS